MEIKIRVDQSKPNINLQLNDTIIVYREGEPQIVDVEYTENGEYVITPDDGVVFENVNIKVNVPLPEGTIELNANGEYDVYDKAVAKVNVPMPEGNIDITDTSEYDVFKYATAKIKDDNLKPENIAEGVEVLRIKGTFRGGIDTSDGTATSNDILLGKTAYVNEQKITGTITTYNGAMSDGAEIENSLVTFFNNEKTHYTKKDLEGATAIKHYAWYQNNNIISVELPDSVVSVEQRAFSACANLERVTLPKNLKTIGNYCFHTSPKISEFILPDTLTSIGNAAFQGTAISTITIPDSIGRCNGSMCADCKNLVSANMGRITLTGQGCFSNCTNLKDVQLGDYVDFVSDGTFKNCTSLETITLPATVTTVSTNVFNGCTNLKEVICLAPNPPKLSANSFDGVPDDCIIKVLASSVEAYKAATNWSVRADYIVEV